MSAVWVFALTGHTLAPFSIGGHRIEFVDAAGVHAAVERCLEPPRVSESSLRAQHDIVTRLSELVDDVLPARFGAWVDEGELAELLAIRRDVIGGALDLVRGRVQMTLRFRRSAAAVHDAPALPPARTGTEYLEAKRRASYTPPPEAHVVADAVRHLIVAERFERGSDRMPTAIYHLIERDSVTQYLALGSKLASETITISGPWPPFAFAPDLWP